MNVTYLGHACFNIEVNGKKLLFDPFISPNNLANHIDINTIECDYILISHGHEDHIADAVSIGKKTGAKVISNFEITTWLEKQGISNVHGMNIGGAFRFDFGSVKYVSALHSSVLPDETYGGNPGGFVIESESGVFYFAGDTGLTYDMKLIGAQFDLDYAILPIGDNFTMGIADAVIASKFIQADLVFGMHYDTFESIKIDTDYAFEAFASQNIALKLPAIGKTTEVKTKTMTSVI